MEALTPALDADPRHPDLYRWRCLARIRLGPLPEECEWNDSFSPERLLGAVEDLGTARLTDGGEALAPYGCLVDRISTVPRVFDWLGATARRRTGYSS